MWVNIAGFIAVAAASAGIVWQMTWGSPVAGDPHAIGTLALACSLPVMIRIAAAVRLSQRRTPSSGIPAERRWKPGLPAAGMSGLAVVIIVFLDFFTVWSSAVHNGKQNMSGSLPARQRQATIESRLETRRGEASRLSGVRGAAELLAIIENSDGIYNKRDITKAKGELADAQRSERLVNEIAELSAQLKSAKEEADKAISGTASILLRLGVTDLAVAEAAQMAAWRMIVMSCLYYLQFAGATAMLARQPEPPRTAEEWVRTQLSFGLDCSVSSERARENLEAYLNKKLTSIAFHALIKDALRENGATVKKIRNRSTIVGAKLRQ